MGFGRGARPVILSVLEAVHRRGKNVVKLIQITRLQERLTVKQARVLGQFAQRLGPHGVDEHAGVDQPVEAAPYRMAAGRQSQRRANAGYSADDAARIIAHLLRPPHQRVAA